MRRRFYGFAHGDGRCVGGIGGKKDAVGRAGNKRYKADDDMKLQQLNQHRVTVFFQRLMSIACFWAAVCQLRVDPFLRNLCPILRKFFPICHITKPKRDGIVQMVHQAGHPARAAAKFKYKRRPHNAPTNTGPKRDGFICVFHRADPTHDKVAHLTVQRHLQTVTNKAKRFFLQHDRLIANGCIERLCHSHRFISGLLSLGNFHQRDQVRRVIRMTADKAFRVLGIFGNFGHKQARSRAGNDCIR